MNHSICIGYDSEATTPLALVSYDVEVETVRLIYWVLSALKK